MKKKKTIDCVNKLCFSSDQEKCMLGEKYFDNTIDGVETFNERNEIANFLKLVQNATL